MSKTREDLINEIEAHITDRGGECSQWYVGITEDAKRRVEGEHGVDTDKDKYIWRTAASSSVARSVEQHFLDIGCDGGPGGGDDGAKVVYAYKKSSRTDP